ncbi:hypothetical protein BC826DRAFT_340130 [Russula brevipes]|nr:hypothetical protein BC826DRAFT_340130 [Russula brevipes]
MSLFTPSPSHCPEHHLRSRPPTAWCMHYCLRQHAPLRAAPHPKLSDPSLRVLGALPPLVPLMIWDFFHERHKVRAGAEAAYRLVERATRPFGRADLDFDASTEGYYKSSTGPERTLALSAPIPQSSWSFPTSSCPTAERPSDYVSTHFLPLSVSRADALQPGCPTPMHFGEPSPAVTVRHFSISLST